MDGVHGCLLPAVRIVLFVTTARTQSDGNPRMIANFLDESINAQLAATGCAAHRLVWASRVMSLFDKAEDFRLSRTSFGI